MRSGELSLLVVLEKRAEHFADQLAPLFDGIGTDRLLFVGDHGEQAVKRFLGDIVIEVSLIPADQSPAARPAGKVVIDICQPYLGGGLLNNRAEFFRQWPGCL